MKIKLTLKEAKIVIARHFYDTLEANQEQELSILPDDIAIVNSEIVDKLESVEKRFRWNTNEKIEAIKEVRKMFEKIGLLHAKLVVESLLESISYAEKYEVLPPVSEHGHFLNFKVKRLV
jgi:ribosomal protein L7/L12